MNVTSSVDRGTYIIMPVVTNARTMVRLVNWLVDEGSVVTPDQQIAVVGVGVYYLPVTTPVPGKLVRYLEKDCLASPGASFALIQPT